MKKIMFVLLITFLFSCKKDEMPFNRKFEESKQAWDTYKKATSNSYSYIAYHSSAFGNYNETKIIVQNGNVTGRVYNTGVYQQGILQLNVSESWTEDISNLNTHTNGAASLTLDNIYEKATQEWLNVDAKQNEVYFSVDTNGLIESCGYVPHGCQDDCFFGVHIKSITNL